MRKRTIKELEVTEGSGANIVRVYLHYSVGGMNYFTYKNEERGLYLSVTPVSVSKGDGYSTESYTAFSGVKQLVKPMKRFSQKQLDTFEPDAQLVNKLIEQVTNKNQIQCKQLS